MSLRFADDVAAAEWLRTSATPWDRLVTWGPSGFAAYARLRFIPDPTVPTQRESDLARPPEHASDLEQTRRALGVLERFTRTPDDAFFCLWDGWGDIQFPPAPAPRPRVLLPHRSYALLRGRLQDIQDWGGALGHDLPPAFVWPADRRWILTSDVDPHWAGIGASEQALAALVGEPGLDVVVSDPSRRPPSYA